MKLFIVGLPTEFYGENWYAVVKANSVMEANALAARKWVFHGKEEGQADSLEDTEIVFDEHGVSQILSKGW